MPNNPRRDKRKSQRSGGKRRLQRPTAPRSTRALLERVDEVLPGLTQQLALQKAWAQWLEPQLPSPLAGKLTSVVEQDGCLTLVVSSAAWGTRLRYALREMEPLIRAHAPHLTSIRVRVSPKA